MSYIAISTGRHIDFVNITPDQICIEDIARGLSNECRFAGQLESFYSVAQHSVYVSHWPMLDSAPPHDDIIIQPLTPPQAYHQFMARFEMLISGKQQKTISYIKPERDSDGY